MRRVFWIAVVFIILCLIVGGCATVTPNSVKLEAEHVSHPLAGFPFEPQKGCEDELNTLSMLLLWHQADIGGAYMELGLGRNLGGPMGGGFYGPAFTGTARFGYEWRVRP